MKCKECNGKLGIVERLVRKCNACEGRRLDEEKKREDEIKSVTDFVSYNDDFGNMRYGANGFTEIMLFHKKDKFRKYVYNEDAIIMILRKNKHDVKKTYRDMEEEIEYLMHTAKLKEKERARKVKRRAEKDYYGRVKSNRETIPSDTRDGVLRKFNNECVVCGADEGLHIHHKDGNSQNNTEANLAVLCGVCHKKAHMTVR